MLTCNNQHTSGDIIRYEAARLMLDELVVPYIAIMGNHDVWWYQDATGDMTPTPTADRASVEIPLSNQESARGH